MPGSCGWVRAGAPCGRQGLTPFLRDRFVVFQDADALAPSGQVCGAVRPQLRSTRHFISSPTVTKVMHRVASQRCPQPVAQAGGRDVGAVQVDLMQDTGAVAGPRGDLRGRAAGVQPQRHGGVPQVVGAAGERGGGQVRAERCLAGGVPGAAVDRLAEHAAAGAAEQPPVRRGAMVAEVTAEHADQDGRDGDDADGAVGAVLETGRLMRLAGVGPGGAGARAGGGEDNLAAAAAAGREDEVVAAQGDGFFRAQRA